MSRVVPMSVASICLRYVNKARKKGRTQDEVDQVIRWLTGLDQAELQAHLDLPPAELIRGVVCKVRVEEVEDPLMQKIRYLDLLVDALARGKPMDKILRAPKPAV